MEDDYWSIDWGDFIGQGWEWGPDKLPPPKPVNLSDCSTGPSEISGDCLKDMGKLPQEHSL